MSEKACPSCGKRFPSHLLSELVSGIRRRLMCPICALKEVNELHGLPSDTPFRGPRAARIHAEAIEWLRTSRQEGAK